jgi:histone deacetylase 11
MIPILYHPGYNLTAFGLEGLHPFDGRKYHRIHRALIERGLRRRDDFVRPGRLSQSELARVHTRPYLRSLRRSSELCRILELPSLRRLPAWVLDWRVLRPMRLATSGTIAACRMALRSGVAINLGGGYHHASASFGGGFCCYADVPLAIERLHAEGLIQSALVIDLDAHQGNGTADAIGGWPWANIADLYERDLFPFPKAPETYEWPVGPGLTGKEYLDIVHEALPPIVDHLKPDLLVYNAGSDPFVGDPLARFRLSREDLAERDLAVISLARERKIPIAMVLSGGYSTESWRIHTDSIEGILTRFDRECRS